MIVSGYLYHRRGAEALWTNLSFHSEYMMSNSTCQRFAWPARAARSASHSYLSYLQTAPYTLGVLQLASDMLATEIADMEHTATWLSSHNYLAVRMEDYAHDFNATMSTLLTFLHESHVNAMLNLFDKFNLATHPVQARTQLDRTRRQEKGISHVSTESRRLKDALRSIIMRDKQTCLSVQRSQKVLGYTTVMC